MTERKLFTLIRERLREIYGKPLSRDLLRRARTEFDSLCRFGLKDALHRLLWIGDTLRRTDLAWSQGAGVENGSLIFFALGLTGVDPLLFGLEFVAETCPEPRFVLHLTSRERPGNILAGDLEPFFSLLVDPVAGFFAAARRRLGMKFLGFRLDSIPIEDPATLDLFARGETEDIWGCSSEASRQWLLRLEPRHFTDLLMLPAWSGTMPSDLWDRPKRLIHPCLESTRGWLLFQEQVVELMRDLGGLPSHETVALVFDGTLDGGAPDGSTVITRMDRLFQVFLKNGVDHGTSEDLARWVAVYGPATMSRAASVAEVLVSWRMAWIKVHHPEEFLRSWEEAIPIFDAPPSGNDDLERVALEAETGATARP